MSMNPIEIVQSKTVVLDAANIDTDQIVPARFLTVTTRDGLGAAAFRDWRFDENDNPTDHILNTDAAKACEILVGGHNFGCGSSREHAPWALTDYGFRVVISSEIADIFRANAMKNGLLPVVIDPRAHQWLLNHPGEEVTVDLEACEVRLPKNGGTWSFEVDAFSRDCLMRGVDELGYLEAQDADIAAYEDARS